MQNTSAENLLAKIEDLENRLAESDQLIEAIKAGEVDAFAVNSNNKSEVFTLQTGDYAYRVLIEKFGEGAVNFTEEGLIVYSNFSFHELLGLPYEKVVGSFIFDFIHPDSKRTFNKLFSEGLKGSSKGEIYLAGNNKIIPVEFSLTSLQPNLATIGMIVIDLTEKKQREAAKLKNEKMLALQNEELLKINKQLDDAKNFIDNVLESSNHGVLSYLAVREDNVIVDFEIRYANYLALEQLNLPAEKVIGKRYLEVMPLAKPGGLFDRVVRVVETGISDSHEINSPNDPDRSFSVKYSPLDDGVTCTFLEITEQKKQEKILQEKNLELERSNLELASFSYVASHDLQEPLRKMQTFSQRILAKESQNFSANTHEYFSRIIAASKRMQGLIEALLAYSRTNTSEIVFTPTDLNTLLEEVKTGLQGTIEEKNAVIDSSPLPVLNIIPQQFNQLLTNIISNAIKYSKENVLPHIKISGDIVSEKDIQADMKLPFEKYWKISIADNGIGFEQQYEHKIFELFQRLHGKSEYEGTGIGLAICKKIMQNHKGFIIAVGKPDVGSVFNIYLPLHN